MVRLPHRRKELFYYISALADPDYQRQVWIEQQYPPGIQYDDFDFAVHFLFDDTPLFDAPEATIGDILEDEEEMHAVTRVIKAVDDLLNKLGTELTDEQYITSPEWQPVVEAARNALLVLKKRQPDSQHD